MKPSYVVATIILIMIAIFMGFIIGNMCCQAIITQSKETETSERFVTYNLDKTKYNGLIMYGAYYIIDTETDNVYLRLVGPSNIGLTILYDENGNIVKAKDLGINY